MILLKIETCKDCPYFSEESGMAGDGCTEFPWCRHPEHEHRIDHYFWNETGRDVDCPLEREIKDGYAKGEVI